ncbi:MAG: exodeoxyribonuclease VII small subunit [Candidatus Margulisiibacteriota bacterium]
MLKEKIKQLDKIIASLDSPDTDLDKAFKLHEDGQKIVKELEKYFQKTEQKLSKLDEENK